MQVTLIPSISKVLMLIFFRQITPSIKESIIQGAKLSHKMAIMLPRNIVISEVIELISTLVLTDE
jgi:hypothetical protein